MLKMQKKHIKLTGEDIAIDSVVNLCMIVVLIVVLYPIIYMFSVSISSTQEVLRMSVVLFPKGFNSRAYEMIVEHQYILPSYLNSILYVIIGTAYSLLLTILGAYPLSRENLVGKKFFTVIILIAMLFNGGLIPTYLIVNDLKLTNTAAAMILPCAISAYYLFVMRTVFAQTPVSIEESAKLDGANDVVILFRIHLPMNIPVIISIMLFYMIAKWNDYMSAQLYLRDRSLYPLQLILRELLISTEDKTLSYELYAENATTVAPLSFRCALVFISILPMAILYPFLQKFFIKGIMIGSVKG